MKMVKTFMKTQHQHVMPPEKGRKERKGNAHSKSARQARGPAAGRLPDGLGRAGGQGKRWPARVRDKAEHDPSPSCVSLQSPRKLKGQFPRDLPAPPAPGRGREKRKT